MKNLNFEKFRAILQETFSEANLPTNLSTLKLGDVEGWDSLGNFNLLLAIEGEFNYRFTIEQMTEFKSLEQIASVIGSS